MFRQLCTAVVLAIPMTASVACKGDGLARTADGVRTLYAPITEDLSGPGEREGSWRGADQQSTWHAILDGPRVIQIDEIVLFTDSARATRRFRFDSAQRLSDAREERTQITFGMKAEPDTLRTLLEFGWSADTLVRAEKLLNGAPRLAQPFEIDNLRYHGVELLMTARIGAPLIFPGAKER